MGGRVGERGAEYIVGRAGELSLHRYCPLCRSHTPPTCAGRVRSRVPQWPTNRPKVGTTNICI